MVVTPCSHQQQLPRPPLSLAQPPMSSTSTSSTSSSSTNRSVGGVLGPPPSRAPRPVSPGLQDLMQWIAADRCCLISKAPNAPQQPGGQSAAAASNASSTGSTNGHAAAVNDQHCPASSHLPPLTHVPCPQDALDALVSSTAITNAVRLLPLGYRPGVTGARVGLLEGLRTPDMDKYDEALKPSTRRAPPTDLSGLSAEEIVARRNRLARQYSQSAHNRRQTVAAMLEKDVAVLRFVRDIVEDAPGIAYLTLSGDMRGLVLYASPGVQEVLWTTPVWLLGRPFPELMHPDDRPAMYKLLTVLVLNKNVHYNSSLRLRFRNVHGDVRQVDGRFRFSAFGVACSLWTVR